jgi:hypothetical protein
MRIAWILGWAAPEGWFAPIAATAFPAAEHVFIPAAPDALNLLEEAGGVDWTVGYSLGSLLLLDQAARLRGRRVALLAPIFSFPREENLGGRVPRANIRQLAGWIRREPLAALADFYERAVLHVPPGLHAGSLDTLGWGLDRLQKDRVEPPLPSGWKAWCGSDDALLDAERLHALDPEIRVVARATHHPRRLIEAWAGEGP